MEDNYQNAAFKIENNGKPFLHGDEASIKVIFNNITRKNNVGKEYFSFIKSQGATPGTFKLITPKESITKTVVF